MKILSIEDEPVIVERLERLTSNLLGDKVSKFTSFATVEDAIKQRDVSEYDLYLLDLNLHGADGFEFLKTFTSYAGKTIIISAYKDKAVLAFDYGVIDFVAKPFDQERLGLAYNRYFDTAQRKIHPRFLSFRSHGKTTVSPLDQVASIAGADKYSEVTMLNGETLLHDKSLQQLEELLPANFERIHKSYIARWDLIETIETKEGSRYFVKLTNGQRLPVSRMRYKSIRERLI
ncbi:LytTR family DNA-binding domain-containing protein [Hyphococcus flavus]|uniref:LytTR family DNA-binding domain-containing protein n=1 Tax=Hyphococcus flavus TaxID=1866326 RepID=A0AAE9ZHT7_9PROT|nr:LytTR family DNA-binding domain-containing protein [Hyphococcus flavus]WDI30480.1 LytTR family DNA-binding domain-containing protein [Hyphococcus flavus]